MTIHKLIKKQFLNFDHDFATVVSAARKSQQFKSIKNGGRFSATVDMNPVKLNEEVSK